MNKRLNNFLVKAASIHGSRYDYSQVNYTKAKDKVTIICLEHGEFTQTPDSHTRGRGCPTCGIATSGKAKTMSTLEFVNKSNKVHNNKYSYDYCKYGKNNTEKVTIVCPNHGEFTQTPADHLAGKGCKECANDQLAEARKFTYKEVQAQLGSKITLQSEYKNNNTPIQLLCKECNHTFTRTLDNQKTSMGCPNCAKKWFDSGSPTTLYYVSINNGEYYKIGVTQKTTQTRFPKKDFARMTVIKEWYYPTGKEALDKEKEILLTYSSALAKNVNILITGNTELFTYDILQKDIT